MLTPARARLALAFVMSVLLAGAAAVAPAEASPSCTASDRLRTCTFKFTGLAAEEWTVPAHITSSTMHVEVRGGSGGKGWAGLGGRGAVVVGTVDIVAGNVFLIGVGGAGGDHTPAGTVDYGQSLGGEGGYPNGGIGGGRQPGSHTGARFSDSGGGGGSSIFGRPGPGGLELLMTAGGGGGGGGAYQWFSSAGGGAGGDADDDGADGGSVGFVPMGGGGGRKGTLESAGLSGAGGYGCTDSPLATPGAYGYMDGRGGPGGLGYNGAGLSTGGGGGGGLHGGGGAGAGGACTTSPARYASGGGGGGGASAVAENLVRNHSAGVSGVRGDGQVVITYRVADDVPPVTSIESGPSDPSASSSATFTFSATDGGVGGGVAGFECKLDGGAFSTCESPKTYSNLADGTHMFVVRAVDKVGNRDPNPPAATWTIDRTGTFVSCETTGDVTTCTFPRAASVPHQTWKVPDGVRRVTIRAAGAAGADGSKPGAPGGRGGRAEGRFVVTPGEVLRIRVGGVGTTGSMFDCGGGGYNGGARGGCGFPVWGGGGGGASDVRRSPYDSGDRLVVGGAGGGGGASQATDEPLSGGDGGGASGRPGAGTTPGSGGTQTGGGARGEAGPALCDVMTTDAAKAGTLVNGGAGGLCWDGGGGGGGGGYYGGGGGAVGGGGGGSGFVDPSATNASQTVGVNDGDGVVVISYGTDTRAPRVTVDEADGQADPTTESPIRFEARFDEPVIGLTTDGVVLSGTALPRSAAITEIAPRDGTAFEISVTGMTVSGTVVASLRAGAAEDEAGNPSEASISADNTVTFIVPAPSPTPTPTATASPTATPTPTPTVTLTRVRPVPQFKVTRRGTRKLVVRGVRAGQSVTVRCLKRCGRRGTLLSTARIRRSGARTLTLRRAFVAGMKFEVRVASKGRLSRFSRFSVSRKRALRLVGQGCLGAGGSRRPCTG